jgi:hypothetical protein
LEEIGEKLFRNHREVYDLAKEIKEGDDKINLQKLSKLMIRFASGYGTCGNENVALKEAREAFLEKLSKNLT